MSASELQDVNQAVLQNEARGATTSSQEQPSVSSSAQGAAFAGRDGAHIPTQEGLPFDIADPLSVRSGSASAAAGPSAADVDGLTARQRYEQLRIHDEHGKMVHIAGASYRSDPLVYAKESLSARRKRELTTAGSESP